MSYPRRKDELVEVARAQMALLIQHAITTSERADKMTVERLEHWVRLVGRVTQQLGWDRERLRRDRERLDV